MSNPTRAVHPVMAGGFISHCRFPLETVKVIHDEGLDDETITEMQAHVQPDSGFFDVDAPVFEGDVVVVADPRRGPHGVERRFAKRVKVNNNAPARTQHTEVIWGSAAPQCAAPVRRLTFENLHVIVQQSAGALFADGHYEAAVAEAFKSIEVRVKTITRLDQSGTGLMSSAFKPQSPLIDVAVHGGMSGENEKEGFHAIFRGAMQGIRNPRAHELFPAGEPQQALEYLAFASLLHRRIDAAVDVTDSEGHS